MHYFLWQEFSQIVLLYPLRYPIRVASPSGNFFHCEFMLRTSHHHCLEGIQNAQVRQTSDVERQVRQIRSAPLGYCILLLSEAILIMVPLSVGSYICDRLERIQVKFYNYPIFKLGSLSSLFSNTHVAHAAWSSNERRDWPSDRRVFTCVD